MATETVTDLANETIALWKQVDKHPLEMTVEARASDDTGALNTKTDVSWASVPAEQRSAATANADVYLDNFISVV